jgi:hypothetical protein
MNEEELKVKLKELGVGIYDYLIGFNKKVTVFIDGELDTTDINNLAKILNDFKEG